MLRYIVILFLLLILPLRANLGETVEQCVARYGRPIHHTEADDKTPFGTVTFVAAGYVLIVFISNDQEVGARVSKVDKSAFSEAEMQTIMSADSSGSPWTPTTSEDPTCLQWSGSNHATILYDKNKHMMIFTSEEMAKVLHSTPEKSDAGNAPK